MITKETAIQCAIEEVRNTYSAEYFRKANQLCESVGFDMNTLMYLLKKYTQAIIL